MRSGSLILLINAIRAPKLHAQDKAHRNPHQLIGKQKEDRGDSDHHENHDRGDGRLLARRPGDLLRLRAHFLHELERADFRHRAIQRLPRPILRTRPAGGSFWGLGSSRKSVTRPLTMQPYLLPVRWSVKRDRGLEVIHFQWCRTENAWKLNEVARVARVRTWPRQYRHARKGQRIPRHAVVHFQYGCGSSAPEGWLLRRLRDVGCQ